MPYMLLIVEDPAQRATRTEAEGQAVYQRMGPPSRFAPWAPAFSDRGYHQSAALVDFSTPASSS